MRIFNLDTLLSLAFYPDGNKKRNRNSQEYRLNIDQYSKNGSDETDSGTIKKHLKNLKVLCLGVASESENSQNKLVSVKLRIDEKKKYKLKKEFQSPNECNPLPIILFYKKKKAKANLQLTDILNSFFLQVITLFDQKNSRLKRYGLNKKAFINIENKYQNQVKQIAENVFKKIENDRQEVNIIGLFIDPYFIRKEYNELVLNDTRPADTLPRKKKDIQQLTFENNINQETAHLNTDCSTINDLFDESLFLDQLFFQPIQNEVENTSKPSEEMDKKEFNLTQLDSSDKTSDFLNSNTLVVQDPNAFTWNHKAKEKIKTLLEEYQKYLQKSYFFYDASITKCKLAMTNDLLNELKKPTCQAFFQLTHQADTKNILNKHRNFLFFSIFSYLFNQHKQTRGGVLLENICVNIKEDNYIRFCV
ncbi:MAG: hypothetical protein RLY40_1314 [Pseudomonadota bacterium]|jgi:hypothetical protein